MSLSELANKRIINVFDGEIIGTAGESDLIIEPDSGHIAEIIVPPGRNMSARRPLAIPWSAVKKIGPEVIVVDIEYM